MAAAVGALLVLLVLMQQQWRCWCCWRCRGCRAAVGPLKPGCLPGWMRAVGVQGAKTNAMPSRTHTSSHRLTRARTPHAPQSWLATPLSKINGAAMEDAVARFNKTVYKMERGLEPNKVRARPLVVCVCSCVCTVVCTWTGAAARRLHAPALRHKVHVHARTHSPAPCARARAPQVVPKLRASVNLWREFFPVVQNLNNPDLKDRHWTKLIDVLGDVDRGDSLTLEVLAQIKVRRRGARWWRRFQCVQVSVSARALSSGPRHAGADQGARPRLCCV